MKMKAANALVRHGCKETELAPARKKASAGNRKLMIHIYLNLRKDDFSGNRT